MAADHKASIQPKGQGPMTQHSRPGAACLGKQTTATWQPIAVGDDATAGAAANTTHSCPAPARVQHKPGVSMPPLPMQPHAQRLKRGRLTGPAPCRRVAVPQCRSAAVGSARVDQEAVGNAGSAVPAPSFRIASGRTEDPAGQGVQLFRLALGQRVAATLAAPRLRHLGTQTLGALCT